VIGYPPEMITYIIIGIAAWLLIVTWILCMLTAGKRDDELAHEFHQAHGRESNARRPDAMPREGSG
jgi:hypothetical protein